MQKSVIMRVSNIYKAAQSPYLSIAELGEWVSEDIVDIERISKKRGNSTLLKIKKIREINGRFKNPLTQHR